MKMSYKTIGKYILIEKIGEGNFADVWLGKNKVND